MSTSSTWRRFRVRYMGTTRARILATVVLLFIIYLLYRWKTGSNRYGVVQPLHDYQDQGKLMPDVEIRAYLRAMHDTRLASCHGRSYPSADKGVVSILLDYNENQFYDLKLTLASIIKHTPEFLIQEIVVLDDGTVSQAIRKHAMEFLQDPQYSKVKVYRSEDSMGPASSRFKAAAVAKSPVIVFVSSSVVVNVGWIEPLIDAVRIDRKIIAVPHHDNLLPGHRFLPTNKNTGNMFGWTLTTMHVELPQSDKGYLTTPVMRGDVFAIDREYMQNIGSYDEGMGTGGGHNLELSLRAWLCGGQIRIIVCSRVAVHSTYKPQQIQSEANFRRIAELWLGDYKQHAYRQSGVEVDMSDSEEMHLRLRKDYLRKLPQCDSFDWYMRQVVPQLQVPTDNALYFGKLKVETGHCIHQVALVSDYLAMELCNVHLYQKDFIFELDSSGMLRHDKRCLQIDLEKMVPTLKHCDSGVDTQRWEYRTSGRLVSPSAPGKCMQQMSTAQKAGDYRHYPMMVDCSENRPTQNWSFIKY